MQTGIEILRVDHADSTPTVVKTDTTVLVGSSFGDGSRFFSDDKLPDGVIEYSGNLTDEAISRLRELWKARHVGIKRAGRVAIL